MIWNEILCIGDSLTYGARDCYRRSYPVELGKILYEKTKEITNEEEKDLGVKSSFKSNEESVETLSKERFPENILILDTETTGLDNESDDCLDMILMVESKLVSQ